MSRVRYEVVVEPMPGVRPETIYQDYREDYGSRDADVTHEVTSDGKLLLKLFVSDYDAELIDGFLYFATGDTVKAYHSLTKADTKAGQVDFNWSLEQAEA